MEAGWWLCIVCLLAIMAGCRMDGCLCPETQFENQIVKQDKEGNIRVIKPSGEYATITMTVPAGMNVAVCAC